MKDVEKNKIVYFFSLPFIGIYYVVDFIFSIFNKINFIFKPLIAFFKYVSLGCYYTIYGLFFPVIYLFNKLSS